MNQKIIVERQKKNEIDKATNEHKKQKEDRVKKDLQKIAEFARLEKAEQMIYEGKITRIVKYSEIYKVLSQTKKDTYYTVICEGLNNYICDCPDFLIQIQHNKNHRCKHILLVIKANDMSAIKRQLEGEDQYGF